MELQAHTKTISDLFSVKKKYIVPRFQREYSWSDEQVNELWDDIIASISISENVSNHEEYFIGSIVLVGNDKSSELQIVDGQQRLTTITILLRVLCERFLEINKKNVAESIYYNYIEGRDDDGIEYFKFQNETPNLFFQRAIQDKDREHLQPKSTEETTLLSSFKKLYSLTGRDKLKKNFGIEDGLSNEKYEYLLKLLREQIVKYLKVIFIMVSEEEEAYTIFETLNARGMNLSFVDLIKNKLFKELKNTHPYDKAKEIWRDIHTIISSRNRVGGLEDFIRHWWISKYSHISADQVYKSFKKEWKSGNISAIEFIKELRNDAHIYVKISSPIHEDFKTQEEKVIFKSLNAFKLFSIIQQKPFLISLFRSKENGIVKFSDFIDILKFMEGFHFIFTAVCSSRASKVDSSYSRAARALNDVSDRRDAKNILKNLKDQLKKHIPEKDNFIEKFSTLKFYKKYEKDKKIIQYIFSNIEMHKMSTDELSPENITLEHILPQSKDYKEVVGMIGNLLPLGKELNGSAENKNVAEKIKIYETSHLTLPKEFSDEFDGSWSKCKIEKRTKQLANYCYNEVWNLRT
jgi:uncharacterized protein with ParB-like and HNH nuclease domain